MTVNTKTKPLLAELRAPGSGQNCYAPYLGMGYKDALGKSVTEARAEAFASVMRRHKKYVYKNDMIVGSMRGLYEPAALSAEEIDFYTSFCSPYPERGWLQGRDHYASDNGHIVTVGIPGIFAEISASRKKYKDDKKRTEFLNSCETAMNGFCDMIRGYIAACDTSDDAAEIKKTCQGILEHAPESFREGLQLVWFTYTAYLYQSLYAMAFGRIDQYLYPLYKKGIEDGSLTEETATGLLENAFIKLGERPVFTGADEVSNICIGGTDKNGNDAVNPLSYCVLHAVENCYIPGPNLSARISKKNPDEFLKECLRVVGTGLGYPALMNNDVNVEALKRIGYSEEDCQDFCMVGCIENFIPGKQPPWSDGRFDVPRYLEHTLNRGKGTLSGKLEGLDIGDPRDCKTMKEFVTLFEKQISYEADRYYTAIHNENGRFCNEYYTNPFMSCLSTGCIEKGLDLCDGGSVYPSAHGAGLMGVATTVDSLSAIEKCVFTDKVMTMDTVIKAINADFKGYEKERALLLTAPKYGNNDPVADKYAVWYVSFISGLFDKYRLQDGGRFYVGMASNTQNIGAGAACGATPDGRHAHAPLSDAASPTYGMDKKGPTMTVASLIKPDYTRVALGTVINQKFAPDVFAPDCLDNMVALLRVYFAGGGQEMQINAVSRDILADAMEHPEKYGSLVVRVSGFSAYYTRLDKSVQHDILNRTEHVKGER